MEPDSNGITELDISELDTGPSRLENVHAIDATRSDEPFRKLAGFTLIDPVNAQFERHTAEPDSDRSEPIVTEPIATGDGSSTSGFGGTKRRGRPVGSKNGVRTPTQTVSPNLENLETLLFSVHLMGASILSQPKFALNNEETRRLGSAIRDVAKHYAFGLDAKKMAVMNLMACAGGIYGPRVIDMWVSRPQKPATTEPRTENVQPIRESKPAVKSNGAPVAITNPSQLWDAVPTNSANDM